MLSQAQIQQYDHEGWLFLPSVFGEDEAAMMLHEAQQIYAMDRQEVSREGRQDRAHRVRGAHLQRDLSPPRPASAADRADRAGPARQALHPSVQAQRQGRVRRRPVAVASGLRHLAPRRRHARGAGDEYRRVPRPGHRVQRAADVHPAEPQEGRARGGPRHQHHQLPAMDPRPCRGEEARRSVRPGGAEGAGGLSPDVHGCWRTPRPATSAPTTGRSATSPIAVENHITRFKRPEWIAHRDFTPIEALADGCLAELLAPHDRAAE